MTSPGLKGFKKLVSLVNVLTSLQVSKKSVAKGDYEFNPFKYGVNDTALITLSRVLLNTFTFNRFSTKWGFDISNLNKDEQGVWRGRAMKDGKIVDVRLDYQGNVIEAPSQTTTAPGSATHGGPGR